MCTSFCVSAYKSLANFTIHDVTIGVLILKRISPITERMQGTIELCHEPCFLSQMNIGILYNYTNETQLGELSAHTIVSHYLQITATQFLSFISDMINKNSYATI
jgi:hypothetical protein